MDNKIIIYERADKKIEVSLEKETIWLTLNQIAFLFDVKKAAISKHIKNIYSTGELQKEATVSILETVQKEGNRFVKRNLTYYNLDAIISVGYRVNSKKATQFRIWATNVLKNYLTKGYAINQNAITQEKLKEIEKTIRFIKDTIHTPTLSSSEVKGMFEIIERYANTWKWIEEFDTGRIRPAKTQQIGKKISYKEARQSIDSLKKYLMEKKEASDIFGVERDKGLFLSSLETIYQTFDGEELYPSFEEKAAHLLYFVVKNHPFIDGNKRIGALLFLMFLNSTIGFDEFIKRFNNNGLTALCYLVAGSRPEQKDTLINLITQMINNSDW